MQLRRQRGEAEERRQAIPALLSATLDSACCFYAAAPAAARGGAYRRSYLPLLCPCSHFVVALLLFFVQIRRQREEEERVKAEEKAKAQAMVRTFTRHLCFMGRSFVTVVHG